jgi:predicted metal-dependent enzyme (double-stranded beta helix superfamily)
MNANTSEAAARPTVVTPAPAPASGGGPVPAVADLLARAIRLAAEPGLADRLASRPQQRTWLPLDAGPGARAWLIAWPPGTGTGWHDHGGASGAMVAVAGVLTERSIEATADRAYGHTFQLPAGVGSVRRLRAGGARAFGPQHIHEVVNEGDVTAYSVHVYAPDLDLMRHYAVSGERLTLVGAETDQDW